MRFTSGLSLLLVSSGSLVASRPAPDAACDLVARDGAADGETSMAKRAQDFVHDLQSHVDLPDLPDLLTRGMATLDEYTSDDDGIDLATRALPSGGARTLHARINRVRFPLDPRGHTETDGVGTSQGDIDLNEAARDGAARLQETASDVDFNLLADQGLAVLSRSVRENDLNSLVMRWLEARAQPSVGSPTKRGLVETAMSTLLSSGTMESLAKTGAKVAIRMARDVDFNSLANKGLDYLNSVVGGTDLNQAAAKGAKKVGKLVERTDLNSLASRGLDVLMS
ncbi:hypothetical protein RJ55_07717 [Drechmeria coniospora]|nr:hypothetical protein RJ55_07717 [Drechmeria coniospora]